MLDAFPCLQGLFFYHTKKVGFVAGVKWGSGILITHILDERGRESWSAPVLFKIHEVSLGLLAGVLSVLGPPTAVASLRPSPWLWLSECCPFKSMSQVSYTGVLRTCVKAA